VRHLHVVPGAAAHRADLPAVLVQRAHVRYTAFGPPALDDVSLQVSAGAFVALVGANGAGKSTLFKAIAGAIDLQAGSVRVFGEPIGCVRRRLAYLPQLSEVDWRFPMLARTFVMAGRYPHLGWLRHPAAADREIVNASLEGLGLADVRHRQIGELSGGQRQRLLLARALAQHADLLLLDEPLTAVDTATQAVFLEVLRQQNAAGVTVLVATHEVELLRPLVDKVAVLADGRLVEVASAPADHQSKGGAAWAG
jgi:ABC-type Mn2+/Zn2+ transport system ATPase subunit